MALKKVTLKKPFVFKISGAVAFRDAEIIETDNPEEWSVHYGPLDTTYTYGLIDTEDPSLLWASRDGKEWGLAIIPEIEELNPWRIRE